MSSTVPSWSTARRRYCRLSLILMNISVTAVEVWSSTCPALRPTTKPLAATALTRPPSPFVRSASWRWPNAAPTPSSTLYRARWVTGQQPAASRRSADQPAHCADTCLLIAISAAIRPGGSSAAAQRCCGGSRAGCRCCSCTPPPNGSYDHC